MMIKAPYQEAVCGIKFNSTVYRRDYQGGVVGVQASGACSQCMVVGDYEHAIKGQNMRWLVFQTHRPPRVVDRGVGLKLGWCGSVCRSAIKSDKKR